MFDKFDWTIMIIAAVAIIFFLVCIAGSAQ